MSDSFEMRLVNVTVECAICGMKRTFPEGVPVSCGCEGTRFLRYTPTPEEWDQIKREAEDVE